MPDSLIQKERAREEFRERFSSSGNLSSEEVEALLAFEFDRDTSKLSLDDQLQRYYLKIKLDCPGDAVSMLAETRGFVGSTMDDTRNLCFALSRYVSGALIYFNGMSLTVRKNKLYINGLEEGSGAPPEGVVDATIKGVRVYLNMQGDE